MFLLNQKEEVVVVAGGFIIMSDQELDFSHDISVSAQLVGKQQTLTFNRDYTVRRVGPLVFVEIRSLRPDRDEEQEFYLSVGNYGPIGYRFGPNRYTGMVDIGAGRIRGWVQRLCADPSPVRLRILVDEREAGKAVANSYRSDLAAFSYRGGYDGFDIPMPEECYDGNEHRIEVEIDAKGRPRISSPIQTWQFQYRKSLDIVSGERVAGWVFDPAAPRSGIDLSVVTDSGVITSATTFPRSDVAQALGASAAGFDFTLDSIEGKFWIADSGSKATPLFGPFLRRHLADLVTEVRTVIATRRLNVRSKLAGLSKAAATELARVRAAGRGSDIWTTLEIPAARVNSASTCVIIPVYRGTQDTIACVESVTASLLLPGTRVIVVNDCSPEEELASWLRERASAAQFELIESRVTRGFVGSVNAALSRCSFQNEDVVLLNSDTLVPPHWIERLKVAAYSEDNVASVTPFSNNATICSYPVPRVVNELPHGMSLAQIDAAFRKVNGGATVPLPTGVGFCMYLRGDALQEVGTFDERWGRGYGEENHWCMVAADLGWKHLLACDLFVFHKGSVSFGEGRDALMQLNGAQLQEMYPEYPELIWRHVRSDPAKPYRANVTAEIFKAMKRPVVVHIAHERGGGLENHVRDLMRFEFGQGIAPLLLSVDGADRLKLSNTKLGVAITLAPAEMLNFLRSVLDDGHVLRCHFHFLPVVGGDFVEKLRTISRQIVVTIHDFHAVCPRLHLLNSSGKYCALPSIPDCQKCASSGKLSDVLGLDPASDFRITKWLDVHGATLKGADLVIAPSTFAADIIRRRFELSNITIIPHPESRPRADALRGRRRFGEVVIAVLGGIGPEKGFSELKLMIADSERRRLALRFAVIGYTSNDSELLELEKVSISGRYNLSDLPRLLDEVTPDLVFVPSIVGETYCFTLSEALSEGLPVVCFDLGAQAERLRSYGYSAVIPASLSPSKINDCLIELAHEFREGRYTERPASTLSFQEYYTRLEQGVCPPLDSNTTTKKTLGPRQHASRTRPATKAMRQLASAR